MNDSVKYSLLAIDRFGEICSKFMISNMHKKFNQGVVQSLITVISKHSVTASQLTACSDCHSRTRTHEFEEIKTQADALPLC